MVATQLTQVRIMAFQPRKTTRDIRNASLRSFGGGVYPTGRTRCFLHTRVEGKRIWQSSAMPASGRG